MPGTAASTSRSTSRRTSVTGSFRIAKCAEKPWRVRVRGRADDRRLEVRRADGSEEGTRSRDLEKLCMETRDKVVIVTGGGSGIGRALCRRLAREGAQAVVVVDRESSAHEVADEIGGLALVADVAVESNVRRVVETVLGAYGGIDLFCSNAGIGGGETGVDASDGEWQAVWQVNVMAHIYAARAVLPSMLAAGHGYLLQTASAAGLLTQIGSAPYAVTKHAAVGFAQWLAVTYGGRGVASRAASARGREHAGAHADSTRRSPVQWPFSPAKVGCRTRAAAAAACRAASDRSRRPCAESIRRLRDAGG